MASVRPPPAYDVSENHPVNGNSDFYSRIAKTSVESGSRALRATLTLPPRSGIAFPVKAKQICRITTTHGPQVGDLNIWNLHNPRERFWASRTRQLHSSHLTIYNRLWSCLPCMRPLVTIISDPVGQRYGEDRHGGRVNDLLGTRCDPYVNKLITTVVDGTGTVRGEGEEYDFHCHSNLTRAVIPWGLHESDVHDVLNVFQVTGLDENGRYWMGTCPAQAGDFFEFFAEVDCLCALSACPGGDLSAWGWSKDGDGASRDMSSTCRPLGIEIFDINDSDVLEGWQSPEPSSYKGTHGMRIPLGEL